MVLNATSTMFQLYRGGKFLLVEEIEVPGVNYLPVASHLQILSHTLVSTTPLLRRIPTQNVLSCSFWLDFRIVLTVWYFQFFILLVLKSM